MATGLVGTIASSGSLQYTPTCDVKVLVYAASTSATGTLSVNGTVVLNLAANTNGNVVLYVGANQTLTVANSANVTSVVSALEGT